MKDLKKTLHLGLGLGVKLLAGLYAVKLCAQYLGPESFGITGHLSSLLSVISLLAGAGVSVGITKVYAGSDFSHEQRPHWLQAAHKLVFGSAALLALLVVLFSGWISKHLFNSIEQAHWLLLGLLVSILPIGFGSIGQGRINGLRRDDLYSISMVSGSMLGLAGVWIGGIYFGPAGALLGMIWLPVAQAIVMSGFAFRLVEPAARVAADTAGLKSKTRFLLGYGALSIAAGAIMPVVYIVIRLLIQTHSGNEIFGLWQATLRISEAYCQLPLLLLSVVLFARFAGSASVPLDYRTTAKTYLFIVFLMACIAAFVYLARAFWIKTVFTPDFLPMEDFVPWQLAGDTLRIVSYLGTTILAARGKVKVCVFAEVLQGALLLFMSAVLIPAYSEYGAYYAYLVSYALYFIATVSMLYRYNKPSAPDRAA